MSHDEVKHGMFVIRGFILKAIQMAHIQARGLKSTSGAKAVTLPYIDGS